MEFLQNKSDLMNEVAVTRAINENFPELSKFVTNVNSVKSSDGNVIPFLLDVLQEVSGKGVSSVLFGDENFELGDEDSLTGTTKFINQGGLMGKVGEIEDKGKNAFIDFCVEKFVPDENTLVGDLLDNPNDPLIETSIKNIDVEEKLKIPATGTTGEFFYGVTDSAGVNVNTIANSITVQPNAKSSDFKRFLHEVINLGEGNWRNQLLFEYDAVDEELKVSPHPNILNIKIKPFLRRLLNGVQLLDLQTLTKELLDIIFGTTVAATGIGKEYLTDKLKFKKYVDKITNNLALQEENEINIIDDSFFVFNKSEIDEINSKAESIINGVNASNLGCGFGENFIDLDELLSISSNNTQTDYPYFMENNIEQQLKNLVKNSAEIGSGEENKDSVSNNIFGEMLNNLLSTIMNFFTLNPIITLITQIFNKFVSGVVKVYGNVKSFVNRPIDVVVQDSINWLKCIWKTVFSFIVEYIFELIKPKILELVGVLTAKIAVEKSKNKFKLVQRTRELLVNVNNILSFIQTIRG